MLKLLKDSWGILLIVGIAGVWWWGDSLSNDRPTVIDREPELRSVCERWVRDGLKAPSTAKFSEQWVAGAGPWTVYGKVDAENSFGAMLRQSWTCEVVLDGATWRGSATLD